MTNIEDQPINRSKRVTAGEIRQQVVEKSREFVNKTQQVFAAKPAERNMTYWEHLCQQELRAIVIIAGGLATAVNGVFPFWLEMADRRLGNWLISLD